MSPFQQFRAWARRAPTSERASVLAVVLVILGILAWQVIPAGGSSSATAGAAGVTTVTGVVPKTPPAPAPKPKSCTNPTGAVPGVSATQIKIAILIVNISGLATNQSLGISSAAAQRAGYEKIIAAANRAGGADCRQLVPEYFNGNPADQSSLQQTCLDVVQSGAFAVVDGGAFAQFPVVDCFPEHQMPYFGGYLLPSSQMAKYYPYLFELKSLDNVYANTVPGLASRGFFSAANGFKKLGLVYEDCYPELKSEEMQWLAKADVKPSQIDTFDLGCPSAFTPATVLEQAILKFKKDNVTNVTPVAMSGDFATFTKLAAAQDFSPKYGIADDNSITSSYGVNAPDYTEIANAIGVVSSAQSEGQSPGLKPSIGTTQCATQTGGVPYSKTNDNGKGCDEIGMLVAALDHAPSLSRSSLAAGLKAAVSINSAYPEGPNDYAAGTNVTYGGQYYRTVQFLPSCTCWRVTDPTYHPGAP